MLLGPCRGVAILPRGSEVSLSAVQGGGGSGALLVPWMDLAPATCEREPEAQRLSWAGRAQGHYSSIFLRSPAANRDLKTYPSCER